MKDIVVNVDLLEAFEDYLIEAEKSRATIEKYLRDVRAFGVFLDGRVISKGLVMEYKQYIVEKGFAPRSVNSMLSSINALLEWLEIPECRVKNLRIQPNVYCKEEKELTKQEYYRLLEVSKKDQRLNLLLQTICGTGIRISELQYFTVEAVRVGEITVTCKGKIRTILIPGKLRKLLALYAKKNGIRSGIIFRTKKGTPLHRSNIWKWMKALCAEARVKMSKVFPHNLRKLFAKTFYKSDKDIAKLADILGHSNINTTRIYIMTSGAEHRKQIERLGLVIG